MTDHSIQDVYSRLGQVEQDVAGIRPILKTVSEDLSDIKRQKNQPFNWIGLGSLVIAVLLYMNTTQQPLVNGINDIKQTMNARTEIVYQAPERFNALEKDMSKLDDRLDRKRAEMTDVEQRVSRIEGLVARLTIQVDQIDNEGSRVHHNRGINK